MEEEPEPRVAIVRVDAEKGNKEKKHPKSIMEIGMLFSYAQAATSYLQYPRFFLYK